MSTFVPLGFGWQPDLPDGRDRTFRDGEIADVLRCLPDPSGAALPGEVDLRRDCGGDYFTNVDDQGPLNASSAFAVLALMEYFERRIHARTFDGSKLFLYQATRHRLSATQQPHADSGADIRGTLKTLLQIGVPAETRRSGLVPTRARLSLPAPNGSPTSGISGSMNPTTPAIKLGPS